MGNSVLIGMDSFDRGAAKLLAVTTAGGILAARKGADVFKDSWKATILARGLVDTGRFYESIHVEQEDAHTILIVTDAVNPKTGQPYPRYLEYGTRFMVARPSARPAFEQSKELAVAVVGEELGRLIMEAFA